MEAHTQSSSQVLFDLHIIGEPCRLSRICFQSVWFCLSFMDLYMLIHVCEQILHCFIYMQQQVREVAETEKCDWIKTLLTCGITSLFVIAAGIKSPHSLLKTSHDDRMIKLNTLRVKLHHTDSMFMQSWKFINTTYDQIHLKLSSFSL